MAYRRGPSGDLGKEGDAHRLRRAVLPFLQCFAAHINTAASSAVLRFQETICCSRAWAGVDDMCDRDTVERVASLPVVACCVLVSAHLMNTHCDIYAGTTEFNDRARQV